MRNVVILCGLLLTPCVAAAQTQASEPASRLAWTLSGLFSVQPDSDKLQSGPYLDGSLGGVAPGAAIALSVCRRRNAMLDFEVSSTQVISEMQDGRLVTGSVPLEGRHRDTFLSILPGYRVGTRFGAVEYKVGLSLVLGQSSRGGVPLEYDIAGKLGVTGGIDWSVGTGAIAAVMGFKYSYVFRGDENYYLGLGSHVVRAAAGVRLSLK